MDLYTIYADHNKNINAKEFIEKMKPINAVLKNMPPKIPGIPTFKKFL